MNRTSPTVRTIRLLTTLLACALPAALAASASAAVTDAGADNTTGKLWRTGATNDLDGDNAYGTDGYILYGWHVTGFHDGAGGSPVGYTSVDTNVAHNLVALPTYIAGIGANSDRLWGGDGFNYGVLQDPNAANADHVAPVLTGPPPGGQNDLVITIQRASSDAFRLTILLGNDGSGSPNDAQTISIDAGAAGSIGSVNHPGLAIQGVNFHLFDIDAGTDNIVLTITGAGSDNTHLTGLAFDSVAPIPAPAALPAGLGLLLAAAMRRRRR